LYKIKFYEDKQGNKPARDYIKDLYSKTDKNNRIRANKLRQYIKYLRTSGTFVGEPVVKHIEGDIWELRPAKDRVFFVVYHKGIFVFLHAFTKKTQKTPEKELERAREEYRDLLERGFRSDDGK